MIWVDDLAELEPSYLANGFRPAEQSVPEADLALVLANVSSTTREHILTHVPAALAAQLSRPYPRDLTADADRLREAQMRVLGAYFWEIVYRKAPDVYEQFSRTQLFPFDRLFPLNVFKGKSVLDAGCGTGKLVSHVAISASRVVGVDPAEQMLAVARDKFADFANVTFARGAFDSLPIEDGSMDAVISNMAFQASEERGGIRGLAEMQRVLRPGGLIAIVVANARTQEFLLEQGFAERVVAGRIRWLQPESSSPLLLMLYALSRDLERETAQLDGKPGQPRYLFAPSNWKPEWTHECLCALSRGEALEDLFHRRDPFAPFATPIFEKRTPQ